MALVRTTLSSACALGDRSIVVASATSIAAGRIVLIDGEQMLVTREYVNASTTVPVLRGQGGTEQVAHVVTAGVVHGDAADFVAQAAQSSAQFLMAGRPRVLTSITATSTLTLPAPGSDLFVILNGTSVITLTIPVPTTDMDGTFLTICGNGAAAHVLTFTGGLSGAGTSYDVLTVNATAPIAFQAVACNAKWNSLVAIPAAGTVTNVTGTLT